MSLVEVIDQLKRIVNAQTTDGVILKGKDASGNERIIKVDTDGSLIVKTQ